MTPFRLLCRGEVSPRVRALRSRPPLSPTGASPPKSPQKRKHFLRNAFIKHPRSEVSRNAPIRVPVVSVLDAYCCMMIPSLSASRPYADLPSDSRSLSEVLLSPGLPPFPCAHTLPCLSTSSSSAGYPRWCLDRVSPILM